jgi:hypothetical protein
VVQKIGPYGGQWDGPATWPGEGGWVYIDSVSPGATAEESADYLRFFKYGVNEKTGLPELSLAGTSSDAYGFASGSPTVTSNGVNAGSALVWITRCPSPGPPTKGSCKEAALQAYSPVPKGGAPEVLWEGPIGFASQFSRPDASNGHIYVGNREGDIVAFSGPALVPSASSLELGSTSLGGERTAEATFTNNGTKLTVTAVTLPSAPFEATGLPAVGSTIEPGQVIKVAVTFRPTAHGSFKGSLGITTKAGETSIALSGTAPPEPTVVTKPASAITQTAATLNATVNPNGGEVKECVLEYGTTTEYKSAPASCTPPPGSGTQPVAVSASVGGLTANTTYHFRVSAIGTGGSSHGADETFKTSPNPPTVATEAASAVAQTSATLNASVNPNGGEVKECIFEFGTTTEYKSAPIACTQSPGSGTQPVAVSAPVSGLTANTTYHFRISAANPGGTSKGSDQMFTTRVAGQLPNLVADPPDNPTFETSTQEGKAHLLLRFNGYIHNKGPGALDFRGKREAPNVSKAVTEEVERAREKEESLPQKTEEELAKPPMQALQRLFTTGTGVEETNIERAHVDEPSSAELIYSSADGHHHWHLQHVAKYSLWNVAKTAEVAPAQKVGFCMEDSQHVEKNIGPSTPVYADNVTPSRNFCEKYRPNATHLFEGISAGWRDAYYSTLAFQ